MRGSFSEAFDLISYSYGWGDEQILDLSLARFQQITAAIQTRKYIEARERNVAYSWMTRTISTYVAAGYMSEDNSAVLEGISKISLDEIERLMLEDGKLREEAQSKEPEEGSFERLMGRMRGFSGRG